MFYELPKFKGYTVDFRLREFRQYSYCHIPRFIPFDSSLGNRLLLDFLKSLSVSTLELDSLEYIKER